MSSGEGVVPFEKVEGEKDLDVVTDILLNVRQHIAKKVSIGNRKLGMTFIKLYLSYVRKCS